MEINLPQRAVIIVGTGLAGLACAMQCLESGANVILIERNSDVGGNSRLASTGINGIRPQDNSPELRQKFAESTVDSATSGGRYSLNEYTAEMIGHLVDDSPSAIDWLQKTLGVTFDRVSDSDDSSYTLVVKEPYPRKIGEVLISGLEVKVLETSVDHPDRCAVLTNTEMVDFIGDGPKVQGIVCVRHDDDYDEEERIVLNGPVVLATGGFGSMPQFVSRFRPDLSSLPTACKSQSTGRIADEATRRNAELTSMSNYQLLPTGLLPFGASTASRSAGTAIPHISLTTFQKGTLINKDGVLFQPGDRINQDLCTRMAHDDNVLLFSKNSLDNTSLKSFGTYARSSESVDQLLDTLGWGSSASASAVAGSLDDGPVIAVSLTPLIMIPLGGLRVDPETMQVNGLENCFAAGEMVGGIHGRQMIVGSSLLSCVVFGRKAARSATTALLERLCAAQLPATKRARRRLKQLRNQLDPPTEKAFFSIPDQEYSLDEIEKHNQEADCWLILKGAVLDISKFLSKHPGGVQAIMANAGCDITENFEAFHDDSIVLKYAKDAVIGRVQGIEPTLKLA